MNRLVQLNVHSFYLHRKSTAVCILITWKLKYGFCFPSFVDLSSLTSSSRSNRSFTSYNFNFHNHDELGNVLKISPRFFRRVKTRTFQRSVPGPDTATRVCHSHSVIRPAVNIIATRGQHAVQTATQQKNESNERRQYSATSQGRLIVLLQIYS